ncbi:TetR/AcrR family transcriptional regulator [Stieleria sp. TO1_6]|uniref:TetR/AcrR family transcriptional regulator n=1 Tax=Stieleria tagensis TaxID=2956795 RepID=UPI00209B2C4C|nr:TetR/AcrR family transcriptional regulator [Stieleria tagensis]MCO8121601.1 TetR/AcrR family transcriptional regulator [Stieleria tagensis]
MATSGKKERISDRKRRAILQAAVSEFRSRGFDNTSMDQIAETANVSKRTVYNHFPSKEDLFSAIMQQLVCCADVIVEFEYQTGVSLEHQLTAIATQIVDTVGDDHFQNLARVVMSRMMTAPELGEVLTQQTGKIDRHLADWLTAAHRDKQLRVPQAEVAAEQLVGLLLSYAFWPRLIGVTKQIHRTPPKKYIKECVTMFLKAHCR